MLGDDHSAKSIHTTKFFPLCRTALGSLARSSSSLTYALKMFYLMIYNSQHDTLQSNLLVGCVYRDL